MRFPIFAKAIEKCDAVLKPHKINIYDILTKKDNSVLDNILHSFVGIAAVQVNSTNIFFFFLFFSPFAWDWHVRYDDVETWIIQIGLVNLLNTVGVIPDYIIGHSFGELGCAYADGCLTEEEMILAAYARGLVQTKVSRISMATVELGYEDIKDLCPPDINVECHNGPDSSIISGPAESMSAFVEKLQVSSIYRSGGRGSIQG